MYVQTIVEIESKTLEQLFALVPVLQAWGHKDVKYATIAECCIKRGIELYQKDIKEKASTKP